MYSKRNIEEIEGIARLGMKLGLDRNLTGYFDTYNEVVAGICISEKQCLDMLGLVEWAWLEYGLEYAVYKDIEEEYGEKPDSDFRKVSNAVKTIRAYADRYNVPQLNQTGVIEDLEKAVLDFGGVEKKKKKELVGKVRKVLGKKLEVLGYKNHKRLLDGVMNTFLHKEHE